MLKYLRSYKGVRKSRSVDILFIRHDADCGYLYDAKHYSPLIDSVIYVADDIGLSCSVLARPFSAYFGNKSFNHPFCLNKYFFKDAILLRLIKVFFSESFYRKKCSIIKKKRWSMVLDYTGARNVIAIQPDPFLCASAKSKKVKVYDLQHGVISKEHNWYGRKLCLEYAISELPDGILCWDNNAYNWLRLWGAARGVKPIRIGHPWFDRFLDAHPTDKLVADAQDCFKSIDDKKPTILVTLQWGLSGLYYKGKRFNGLMCDSLVEVITNTSGDLNWLIRIHPVQLMPKHKGAVYKKLSLLFGEASGIHWDFPSYAPLPLLLKKVDLHITDMSSVVIEAASMGVRSAILSPHVWPGERLESLYKNERDAQLADVLGQDYGRILKWIFFNLKKERCCPYSPERDKLRFFLSAI